MGEKKIASVVLEYQNTIPTAPVSKEELYGNACKSDSQTIAHWYDTWLKNIRANKERFGSFREHSVGQLFGRSRYLPAIIAGAGPSLKRNAQHLTERDGIPLVSCLHNFHYLEDIGAGADYYCTLDAGDVTIEEVTEGGTRPEAEYWEKTKGKKLCAFIGTSPRLLEKWQGEVYFFNAPVPNVQFQEELEKIEVFNLYLSNGGNVLGSCLYLAKAILGASTIVFVGADFSFGYPEISELGEAEHHFHSWKSKYDAKMGKTLRVTDVYGNKIHTWPSYYAFKNFFDWVAIHVPGEYINATEGGCLGAYPEGNIAAFKYMDLKDVLRIYKISDELKECCENSEVNYKKILF